MSTFTKFTQQYLIHEQIYIVYSSLHLYPLPKYKIRQKIEWRKLTDVFWDSYRKCYIEVYTRHDLSHAKLSSRIIRLLCLPLHHKFKGYMPCHTRQSKRRKKRFVRLKLLCLIRIKVALLVLCRLGSLFIWCAQLWAVVIITFWARTETTDGSRATFIAPS